MILFLGMIEKHRTPSKKDRFYADRPLCMGGKGADMAPKEGISSSDKGGYLPNSPVSCSALKSSKGF